MKKNYNFKDRQKYIAEILGVDVCVIKKSSFLKLFSNIMVIYLTEDYALLPKNYMGGITLLVDKYGGVLKGYSYESEKDLIKNFKDGKRTPIEELKNS